MKVINVYEPDYDSAAAYWPHVHSRIITALVIEQLTLLGVFSLKGPIGFVKSDNSNGATHNVLTYLRYICSSTPFMILLPIGTLIFQSYCRRRFHPVFANYPLQVRRLHRSFSSHACAAFPWPWKQHFTVSKEGGEGRTVRKSIARNRVARVGFRIEGLSSYPARNFYQISGADLRHWNFESSFNIHKWPSISHRFNTQFLPDSWCWSGIEFFEGHSLSTFTRNGLPHRFMVMTIHIEILRATHSTFARNGLPHSLFNTPSFLSNSQSNSWH